MNSEVNRLQTFSNWPISAPVSPPRIARAGFFYTGVGLEVQCFCCFCKIKHWNHGDQVMWRHRQLKPNCPFVLNPTNSDNIPILDVFECSPEESPSWRGLESQTEEENGPQDYGLTEEDEMYRSDALRLLSFINWDDSTPGREALVNAGFYHAGDGRIRCAWCGGELGPYRNFGALENPVELHRMYFPRCDHAATVQAAQRSNSNNFSEPSSPPPVTPPIRSPERNRNQTLSSGAAHNSRILNAGNTWRGLGVVGSGARHLNMASLATRLATFDRWPSDRTQSPKDMAEAGFFHTRSEDQVRCFYCDGGLGKWEAGDAPWSEHARWFPTCGYVLLMKGQEYIDQCKEMATGPAGQRTVQAPSNGVARPNRNPDITFPVTEAQVDECMESPIALGALGAGLDAARVRRALQRRLRTAGTPFTSSEALIDAVLDDQLNEEAWSVSTQSHQFASNIINETLRELGPTGSSESDRTRTPSPNPSRVHFPIPSFFVNRRKNTKQSASQNQSNQSNQPTEQPAKPAVKNTERQKRKSESEKRDSSGNRSISLEEENRQLKEARLCKVCMDSEVSVVFLPCGHLVSCAECGAALAACPLCRCAVRALVRAYLA